MSDTTHYHFPLIAESQSNKYLTHNDAMNQIDAAMFTISGGFVVPAAGIVYSDGTMLNSAGINPTLTFATGVLAVNLANGNAWTSAQRATPVALATTGSIAVDLSLSNNFSTTLTGNATLNDPSNANPGQSGIISVKQDGTGSRTLAFGSAWKFTGGLDPTMSSTAGALDILSYYVVDSTHVVVSAQMNFS